MLCEALFEKDLLESHTHVSMPGVGPGDVYGVANASPNWVREWENCAAHTSTAKATLR